MEKKLENLDLKLEDVRKDIADVKDTMAQMAVILAKQEQNLEFHIHRTNLAEENIALLRAEVKPLNRHVAWVEGALKTLGAVASLLGLIIGALKLYQGL